MPSFSDDADAYVLAKVTEFPNLLVPHFLIHSWCYYKLDDPIISDDCFDELVKRLGDQWAKVRHPHKHLIDRSLLKSGFYLQYPSIVEHAAESLRKNIRARRNAR